MWWEKVLEFLTISASYFLKHEWMTKPACVRLGEKEVKRASGWEGGARPQDRGRGGGVGLGSGRSAMESERS